MDKENTVQAILRKAEECGFCAAGFSSITPCSEESTRLREMIRENRHGEMLYMQKNIASRDNPENLLPGAKTVFSAAMPYHFPLETHAESGRLSRYAMVRDYHRVLSEKLEEVLECIRENHSGEVNGKVCVDGIPVFEKSWAEKAGLGRKGKNTMLIVPDKGSLVFLGEILLDIELPFTPEHLPDPCGECDSCINSCPTGAIIEKGKIDARKCISYLTVELKREFTPEEFGMTGEWMFGCDICQEVCPHNQKSLKKKTAAGFEPQKELLTITPEEILSLTKSGFKKLFASTPVYRTGLKRLKRNARAVLENLKEC